MRDLALIPLRAMAFLSLAVSPGAWVGFGPLGRRLPFWAGLCPAVTLSPLILVVPFIIVRLPGVPFGPAAVLLAFLGVPAALGRYLVDSIYTPWPRMASQA